MEQKKRKVDKKADNHDIKIEEVKAPPIENVIQNINKALKKEEAKQCCLDLIKDCCME